MKVGYVGLGTMGAPMAANLAARFDTFVWNRTATVAEEHAQRHGTTAVGSVTDLADVDVLCTCLPTDVEVAAVVDQLEPRIGPDTVWLDHTSGDPDGSRSIAARLRERGVGYLDAPVSGGPSGAQAATLTVMLGGADADLERVSPVLDAVSGRVFHVGDVGTGMAVKAVNQFMVATSLWAASEGLVALTGAGIPAATALEVINTSSGRSFATEQLLGTAVTREFAPRFGLALLAKDVGIARDLVETIGLEAPLLELVDRMTEEASGELGTGADYVEIVRILERRAGVEIGG